MNLNNEQMKIEKNNLKSIAGGSFDETFLEDGFFILSYKNDNETIEVVERRIDSNYIQFHFCTKGEATFVFNQGTYRLPIHQDTSLLLYNPQRDLPIHLEVQPNCWLVSLVISLEKFHRLFSQDASYVTFLSDDNRDKKYYKDGVVSPSMACLLYTSPSPRD